MLTIAAEQRIERAPADVFRFVATEHFRNHPRWDPDVLEMDQTSPGAMGAGTTARVVRRQGRKTVTGTAEVIAYEPDSLAEWDVRFGAFRLVQRCECVPESRDATTVRLTIETHAEGLLGLALPLMRRRFEGNVRANLKRMRDLVEREG